VKRRLVGFLLGFALLLGAATGVTLYVATTEAGAQWVLTRVDAAVGGTLNWSAAEGTLLRGMQLDDVAYDDGSSLVRAQRLAFAWQPWRLLDATLVLDSVEIRGLRHQTRVTGAPLTEEELRSMLFELPISVALREFRVDDIEVRGTDGAVTVLDSVAGAAALDGDALTLTALDVRQDDAHITGDLRLAQDLGLSGTLEWQVLYDGQTYAGTLVAGGSLRQLELTHELTQPAPVSSRGTLVAGVFGEPLSFDLQHQVPAQSLAAFDQSDLQLQGDIRTAGTPEQIAIDGKVQAQYPGFEQLDVGFALTYRDAAVLIDNATLASTQIGLSGNGELQLEPLSLRFDWTLQRLDAGEQLPQVRLSDVTGTGSLQLARSGEALAGALQLQALTGTLNGHPLAVSGLVNADASGTAALELRAASGANVLDVAGTAGPELALTWNVQAPALDVLWQGLSGELNGSGSISGTPEQPQANGELNGALRLARADTAFDVESLALSADYGANGNDLRLQVGTVTRTESGETSVLLQQGELTLTGTPARHTLRGRFTAPDDTAQLAMQGSAADGNWRGTLDSAALDSRAGAWELEAPVALDYTAGALSIAENCWTYQGTRLCAQGGKPAGQGFDVELVLTALPLTWLNPVTQTPASKPAGLQELQEAFALELPAGVQVEGVLDAQLAVRNFQGGAWDSLDVVLQPSAVVVEITPQVDSEDPTLASLVQRFGIDVNLGELHSSGASWGGAVDLRVTHEADGNMVTQGSLRGRGELAADDSVSGSADFSFSNMAWLEFLVPAVRDPVGALNGTIGISGTRERPVLQANAQLREGSFDLPLYGLDIRNAGLLLDTGADGVLRVTGSAQSGEGTLNVRAALANALQPARTVTAEVNGANFLAFSTDYATVSVSPQLRGSFADEVLTVSGSVEVADTEVDLEEVFGAGGDNAVTLSRDVIIVSGEPSAASAAQGTLPIAADLVVRLGENVHVSGYDLDAYLNGELTVELQPGRPVLVYGELGIPEGRYEIYNQQLNARDGRLVFFGNPANPLLDVRAFRETESGEVGVLLTGNLDSIQGRLYSTPTLPDQEALALLVTGKSFSSVNAEESDALVGAIASFGLGRGEGLTDRVGSTLGLDTFTVGGGTTFDDSALGLGKYLTPDLLMRYKIGLFDRQSVLGIEYTLSERLKLEVETGISQSVDLNYTIEKD
jgi:translocation and assembly module TamB